MGEVIPYKAWLLAKRRRLERSMPIAPMQPNHPINPQGCIVCHEHCCADCECYCHEGTDCMSMPDVVHSAEFDCAMLGLITNAGDKPPIRGRAVLCDVNINVDTTGLGPKER
jgi:hypothetical protein